MIRPFPRKRSAICCSRTITGSTRAGNEVVLNALKGLGPKLVTGRMVADNVGIGRRLLRRCDESWRVTHRYRLWLLCLLFRLRLCMSQEKFTSGSGPVSSPIEHEVKEFMRLWVRIVRRRASGLPENLERAAQGEGGDLRSGEHQGSGG